MIVNYSFQCTRFQSQVIYDHQGGKLSTDIQTAPRCVRDADNMNSTVVSGEVGAGFTLERIQQRYNSGLDSAGCLHKSVIIILAQRLFPKTNV